MFNFSSFRQRVSGRVSMSTFGRSLPPKAAAVFLILVVIALGSYYFFFQAPRQFPSHSVITVVEGGSLSQIAQDLKRDRVIKSAFWFTNFVIARGGEKAVTAGDYYFDGPVTLLAVVDRITEGRFGLLPIKVTIPEGFSVFDIGGLFKSKFNTFDETQFLVLARDKEGYLFPDTYLFMPNVKAEQVIEVLEENFREKLSTVVEDIMAFGQSEKDVITMASILEEEARTTESRRMISGILWKRLGLGMPLQVDATFQYINGKISSELTLADLKIDSPYNTYVYKGLPPTPISNPGLDSIKAAVLPTESRYLYFLSDDEGTMYYAATLAEHMRNKERYLK